TGDGVQIQPGIGARTAEHRPTAGGARRLVRLPGDGGAQRAQQERRVHLGDDRAARGDELGQGPVEGPERHPAEVGRDDVAPDARGRTADLPRPDPPEDRPGAGQPVALARRERGLAERTPEVGPPDTLQAAEGIEGPLGRNVRGASGGLVEATESTGAEDAERLPERPQTGHRRVLTGDSDRAVEGDDGARFERESADVLYGTGRGQ